MSNIDSRIIFGEFWDVLLGGFLWTSNDVSFYILNVSKFKKFSFKEHFDTYWYLVGSSKCISTKNHSLFEDFLAIIEGYPTPKHLVI